MLAMVCLDQATFQAVNEVALCENVDEGLTPSEVPPARCAGKGVCCLLASGSLTHETIPIRLQPALGSNFLPHIGFTSMPCITESHCHLRSHQSVADCDGTTPHVERVAPIAMHRTRQWPVTQQCLPPRTRRVYIHLTSTHTNVYKPSGRLNSAKCTTLVPGIHNTCKVC